MYISRFSLQTRFECISREATHLTTNQYNWLGTIFYLSYLVFEYPQNLALQRFPVGKWMRYVSPLSLGGPTLIHVQSQHLCLGYRALLPRSLPQLRRTLRRAPHLGHVRGIDYRRLHDRQFHVLHQNGADPSCRILVYVIRPFRISVFLTFDNSFDERNWYVCRLRAARATRLKMCIAQIISGFISFGSLHIHTPGFEPWQW